MAIEHGYTTLAAALTHLGVPAASSESAQVENWIESSSRAIDAHCHRRIYSATETRVFTPTSPCRLWVPDLLTVTTLKTDDDGDRTYEVTWATTDYYLGPDNADVDGRPYQWIETDGVNWRYAFPRYRRSVQVVGVFGYATTVPPLVEQACLRLVARQYALKLAPLGVQGTAETGFVRVQVDRDVAEMLRDYKLMVVA